MNLGSVIGFKGTALGTILLVGGSALGQGAQVIMMDDGVDAAPRIMHFSMPDLAELRQPDFVKRDVPTFREKLVLSDDQTAMIERLIDAYLESFKKLLEEHLPKAAEPVQLDLGGGLPGGEGNAAGGEGIFMAPAASLDVDELGDLSDMIDPALDEIGGMLPRRVGIGVDVNVGGPGEDGAAEDGTPRAGVVISLEGAEGEEIPEETRKRMEEAANRIAAEIQRRLEERATAGEDADMAAPLLPLGGQMSIEDMEKRQAELAQRAEALRKAKASLRQGFVNDAQSYLTPEQIERWPALERTLLRQRSLPKGRLAGERVDLLRVLKQVQPDDTQRLAMAAEAEEYEAALDAALRQRDAFLAGATTSIDEAMRDGDPAKALSIVDRATALRSAVRMVNMQHADVFASKLPAERAEEFSTLVRKVAYPSVYRTTHAQKAFVAAQKIEDLDAQVRTSIADLEQAYLAELASVNAQLRQTIDRYQPLEARRPFENTQRVMQGERPDPAAADGDDDPIRKAFERRRELDRLYMKLVNDLLTPEQAAQLPKPPARGAGQPIIIRNQIRGD